MTHATPQNLPRHDTLQAVTGKSGRGTARQTIRMDEELWKKLDAASKRAKSDRSDVLRRFAKWYVRESNAELPQRPEASE